MADPEFPILEGATLYFATSQKIVKWGHISSVVETGWDGGGGKGGMRLWSSPTSATYSSIS